MSFPLEGNFSVKTAVLSCIETDRIPHAIIIDGDKGLGKHTLTMFLAKAGVCSEREKPCGVCRNCHLAEIGSHPDIIVVSTEEGKKNITVAQIRSLRAGAYIKPHMAARKFFIVDGADLLNEQAQNAFLKVLEEPPAGVCFILIAQSKAALLDTIISRCVCFSLSVPDMSDSVKYIKSKTGLAENEIKTALEETSGNIGLALQMLCGESDNSVGQDAKQFVSLISQEDYFGMLSITAKYEKNRVLAGEFLKEIKAFTAEEIRKNRNKAYGLKGLYEFYDALCGFEKSLITNINLSLLFSALCCKAESIAKNSN